MKTFAHYLKSSKRGTGFLQGVSGQGITMWISVWSTSPISVFLGASMHGLPRCFNFAVLPFGLSSACFCFTKLLRPLVKRWRSMSHSSFVYLDDGFGSQPDQCSAAAAAVIQKRELNSSGFLVNEDKSHWDPVQIGEWLGFVINAIAMTFQIPEARCESSRVF